MFGRNKKKTKQSEYAMPNMNNFGVTDADMNDKDLLREYQMLMKEVGVKAPPKNNMSLEEELGVLGNFEMDEKNLLSTINNSVNRSTNLTNKTNNNMDNIDNIDNIEIDDDDLNDPDLLKELNLITDGKGNSILNSSGNEGNNDIAELKDIMRGENLEEEILDPEVAQLNFSQKKISPVQLNNPSGPIPNINDIGNIKNIYNENIEVDDSESNKLLQSMGINIGGNQLPPKPNRVQSAVSQNNTSNNGGISFEEKMKCQDLTRLEKYIEEEQKLANTKLKQRDIESAKKAMDNMKALKERFAQLSLEKKKQTPASKGNSIHNTQQQSINNNRNDENDEEIDETKINGKIKVNGSNLGLNADFDIDFGNIDDVDIDVDDEDLDDYEEELLKTMNKAPINEQSTPSKQQSQKPQQPEINFPEIPIINNNMNNNMGSMNNMNNMSNNNMNNMNSINNMNNMNRLNNNMGNINNMNSMNNMNKINNNMGNMNNNNNMGRMNNMNNMNNNNNMGRINNMNNMNNLNNNNNMGRINNMNNINNNMNNMNNNMNNINNNMNKMNNMNNNMNNNSMGRMNNIDNQMNNIDNGNSYNNDSISMNNSIINYDISFDEANNTIIKDNVNNGPSPPQMQKPKPQMQPSQKEPLYEKMSKGELLKMLHERENEYKTNAVVLNRQGKKPEAYTFLNKYKSIKAAIDVVNLTGKLPTNFEVPENLSKSSSKYNLNGSSHSLNSSRKNSLNSLKTSKLPKGQNQSVANSRSSSNQSLNKAPLPIHPNSPFSLPNVRGTGKQFKNEAQAEKFYNEIESKINQQIEKCNTAVKIYYSKQNKQEALRLHKMKKLLNESVESIKILKSNVNTLGDMEIPNFIYENVDYITENINEDIGMSEMEIEIVKATGLYSREVKSGSFNSYVVCNSHYPTDENAEVFQTKIVSDTNNPEFNYKKRIKIVRGKPLLRFIERKKLVFEIFHDKGFLRKNIPLGKANIKIDQLATKSELHFSVNLCDSNNPRKLLDGKLDVNIKLHMPLAEHELVIKTEKWAILDMTVSSQQPQPQLQANKPLPSIQVPQKSPAAPARGSSSTILGNNSQSLKSPASSTPTNQTSVSPQHLSANIRPGSIKSTPSSPAVSAKSPVAKSPSVLANSPVQKSPVSPSSSKDNEELEQLIEQFENPSNIVSNNVLENEQKIIQQQVVEAKLKKLPTYNELNDKLQAITIQIQMLVTKIESGILSLEDYVKQLNEAIVNTKKMAASFKKYGRIDLAKKALIRIKIMEKELEEGDEEDE